MKNRLTKRDREEIRKLFAPNYEVSQVEDEAEKKKQLAKKAMIRKLLKMDRDISTAGNKDTKAVGSVKKKKVKYT